MKRAMSIPELTVAVELHGGPDDGASIPTPPDCHELLMPSGATYHHDPDRSTPERAVFQFLKPTMSQQPENYIITLAQSFPTLDTRTPKAWEVDRFMSSLGTASTGERHAMLFIANVWNPAYAREQGWVFDAIDALGSWDSRHRQAFLNWEQSPYFP
jgi:hypothetical protein